MSDTVIRAAFLILMLILPLLALLARRVPWRTTLLYGAIWLAIAILLGFSTRFFT
ncbi:hypothetical protein [Sphingomonas sp. NPDC079357]|uniref:hypothetical protein n=1 Tax=Sphingomonas sp. NPDC079357 TaxID=3364518 RepID=UPI00384A7783